MTAWSFIVSKNAYFAEVASDLVGIILYKSVTIAERKFVLVPCEGAHAFSLIPLGSRYPANISNCILNIQRRVMPFVNLEMFFKMSGRFFFFKDIG